MSFFCRRSLLWIVMGLIPSMLFAGEWPDSYAVRNLNRSMSSSGVLDGTAFTGWAVFQSPAMDAPVVAAGHPVAVDPSDPANSALQMILAATASSGDFVLQVDRQAGKLRYIHLRELRDDVPVLGGKLDVVLNSRNEMTRWSLRDYSSWPSRQHHVLSPSTAAANLRTATHQGWGIEESERSWYPDFNLKELRPAYYIRLKGSNPADRWDGIVDASTGEVLLEWPGIQTDVITATVRGPYWQPYDISPPEVGIHPFEMVAVNSDTVFTNNAGVFSGEAGQEATCSTMLRGPYVIVTNEDAPAGTMSLDMNVPFSPFNWDWTTDDASVPELNLFHHTQFIHDWYKDIDPAFNALDYPVPAVANVGSGYDNAYWNGYGTYYGSGSMYHNFAMFSDVIYHEYSHGVTDGIYPNGMLPYIGQSGAMNEAWSDYIACSINDDPLMGEYIDGSPHSYFRNLESTMVFPQNWVGEVHGDSPFISAPLWTIRQSLGQEAADSLAHFARYALTETFLDYFVAVLETDDDDGDISNGTPHDDLIYGAFGDHGIGPGLEPHFAVQNVLYHADGQGQSIGDGDRFIEQGETAELTFTLSNDAILFPPPATDVQVSVTTASNDVSVINGEQNAGTIPAGSYFNTSPILLQISQDAPDHWVVLTIDVTTNGGSYSFTDSLEFTVGTPHLLIVDDDPSSDVERFVRTSARAQDRIYDLYSPASGDDLPADRYPGYGMIIWLSGNETGDILTATDRDRLGWFLDAGNKVVLSGQNIVDDLNGSEFAQNVLQTAILPDTNASHAVTATGSPFVPDEWYLTTGTGGAANQTEKSAFVPSDPSTQIFYYGRDGVGPTAGITFANGNGLLLGFGIEAVSGMAGSESRATFLNRLYEWAGNLLGDVNEPSADVLPQQWKIGPAYPNPFNASTTITYSVPHDQKATLMIYDVLGRIVQTMSLPAGNASVHWTPHAATGVYFAQIHWNGGQTHPIKLLQLR